MKKIISISLALFGAVSLWVGVHVPSIFYGTQNVPLHVSYLTADEQSPINGALHMLKEKSPLGLKNQNTLYYGPVFSLFAVPAVVADYGIKTIKGEVRGAESYKEFIIWDWGGMLSWARVVATTIGFLGLLAVFLLFQTKTINPTQNKLIPFFASLLLASNFLYFEYSGAFRHWVFVVVFLFWQLYLLVLLMEGKGRALWIWVAQSLLTVATFGISYVSVLYQVFWLPMLIVWVRKKEWQRVKEFCVFALSVLVGFVLVVWWHPYGFIRVLGLVGLVDPISIGPVLDLGTKDSGAVSLVFYTKVFFANMLPLFLAGTFLMVWGIWEKRKIREWWLWGVFSLPAIVNIIIFSIPTHHESRYMLPTVILFLILVAMVYSRFALWEKKGVLPKLSSIFLFLAIFLGTLQISLWQRIMLEGPVERQYLLKEIHLWQEKNPEAKILLVKDWPLGYVHTRDAYVDYVERFNKSSYELWQNIIRLDPPKNITPINVYYSHSNEVTADDYERYGRIVVHKTPNVGKDIAKERPMDEFDVRPWHLLRYSDYQESFVILK